VEQATVEPAVPQGSAAPGQDTSAPAAGDAAPASAESFGTVYRQHVTRRALRQAGRAGASSAGTGTSATDEQPAPGTAAASRPGAEDDPGDGGDPASAPPSLTRRERKALATGQAGPDGSPDPSDDPIVARVDQVERTVTDGLSRLEGLLRPQTPGSQEPDAGTAAYRRMFGDDAEFERRAQVALHGSQTGQYLSVAEGDELAKWASNREAREFSTRQQQTAFSSLLLQGAEELGVDPALLRKPGTTFRQIFDAFGRAAVGGELTTATERIAKLEAANRQLADENEALAARLPAGARSLLAGGQGAVSRSTALADRTRMSGRQLMAAGLERQATPGRRGRPGAR
jgi:hypothetical protein